MNNKKKKYTINWAKYFSRIILLYIIIETLITNSVLAPNDDVFKFMVGIGLPLANFGLSTEVYYE